MTEKPDRCWSPGCDEPVVDSMYDDWWCIVFHACQEHLEEMRENVEHDNRAIRQQEGYE
jgi:hypothetical protein